VAQFVEGVHAQGADGAGAVAGQLGAFAGEDGLGVQGAFVFAGLLDLGEPAGHVVPGLDELADQDRGGGRGQRVGELHERPGPVAGERVGQRPSEGAYCRVEQGAAGQERTVAGDRGQCVQGGERRDGHVHEHEHGQGQQEGDQRQPPAQEQGGAAQGGPGPQERGGVLAEEVDPCVERGECDKGRFDGPARHAPPPCCR
jgi:hypothetical protein